MNAEYNSIAKDLAVVLLLVDTLREQYISSETPAKKTLICEQVPYSEREVEELYVQKRIEKLLQEAASLQRELDSFEWRRRDGHATTAEVGNEEQRAGQGHPSSWSGSLARRAASRTRSGS